MRPENEAELAEAVQAARGPLRIRGGGTRSIGGPAGEVLETGGVAGITLYEPGSLTLVAGAGTPLHEIEAALGRERQRLAFEVPDLRGLLGYEGASTIGGVVAANASGPRRIQAGACRDSLLGVRFVDGAGRVIKNGGRVMKNVTGYDLVKLMAGARGTLGVLTAVSLRVQAVPEAEATLACEGLSVGAAVAALARALGGPFDVSGAAHLAAAGRTVIRLEGMAGSVRYRSAALGRLLGAGWEIIEGDASATLWRSVRDVTPLAGRPGAVWRVSVKPSDGPGVVQAMGGRVEDAVFDWGGGLLWLLMPEEEAGATALRRLVAGLGGHATLMRGSAALRAAVPAFQPQAAGVAAMERGLRARFDPRGILNAGMMG